MRKAIVLDKQSQHVGDNSNSIQAARDVVVVNGVSYEAARQIALDVYQANFPVLADQAAQLARARATELTEKFLKELHAKNPAGLDQATSPGFQNALLNAQKQHACAGDERLADLLVDLLVDRTKQEQRSLIQIVLDQALDTAPKLTENQLAILGLAFLLGNARMQVQTWEAFVQTQNAHLAPVLAQCRVTPSALAHLQFAGCAQFNQFLNRDLVSGWLHTYSYFFQTGFPSTLLPSIPEPARKFVGSMPNKTDVLQVNILGVDVIDELKKRNELGEEGAKKLTELFTSNRLDGAAARAKIVADMPYMAKAFEFWEKYEVGKLTLSSVGIAIGHAFVKKTVKQEFGALSIWIQ